MARKILIGAATAALLFLVARVAGLELEVRGPGRGGEPRAAGTAGFDPKMTAVCERACSFGGAYDEAQLVAQPGARRGDLTRCVVSGVVFAVRDETPHVAHAGADYVFCCGTCAGLFTRDPGRFVHPG